MNPLSSLRAPLPPQTHLKFEKPTAADLAGEKKSRIPNSQANEDFGCIIDYTNSRNETKSRRISIKSVTKAKHGAIYLNSYYYEAMAPRQFRADRASSVYDIETGELITDDPVSYFEKIAILKTSTNDRKGTRRSGFGVSQYREVYEAIYRQVKALTYIGQCDGAFTSIEKDLILDYCNIIHEREYPSSKYDKKAFSNYIDKQRISHEDYLRYLREIFYWGDDEEFIATSILVIMSDDKVSTEEEALLEVLESVRNKSKEDRKEFYFGSEEIDLNDKALTNSGDNVTCGAIFYLLIFICVIVFMFWYFS